MDCLDGSPNEQIAPLLEMIGKLHCLVDNRIHLQQAAGTTRVGYNTYYSHKIAQINGLANYGGTRATREFLIHDQRETEKVVLDSKAKSKQLSSVHQSKGKSGSASIGSTGGDGDHISKSSRSKHNKRQWELYQK